MSCTVEQIRAGITTPIVEEPRPKRICMGASGIDCNADITALNVQAKRCPICRKRNNNAKTVLRRQRKREQLRKSFAVVTYETDAELTMAIVEKVRLDWPTGMIAEHFGISVERLRALHCAHYQRRATMEIAE